MPTVFESLDALCTHKRTQHSVPFNRSRVTVNQDAASNTSLVAFPPTHLQPGQRWGHLTVDGVLRTDHMTEISGMEQAIQRVELLEADVDADRPPSHLFDIFSRRRKDLLTMGAYFLHKYTRMKVSVGLRSVFQQIRGDPPETITDYARAPTAAVFNLDELSSLLDRSTHHLWLYIEDFLRNGSGWQLRGYASIFIDLYQLPALRVGSYQMTPRELGVKRGCIINVRSEDNFCFKWAIIAGYVDQTLENTEHPISSPTPDWESVDTYENCRSSWEKLNFKAIPRGELTVRTAKMFETDNPNIALNIYEYPNHDANLTPKMVKRGGQTPLTQESKQARKAQLKPLTISEYVHSNRILIHLLLLKNPSTGDGHMVAIRSLERFFVRPDGHRTNQKICPKCFHSFVGHHQQTNYEAHVRNFCSRKELDKYNVDFKGDFLEFKSPDYFFEVPFQIIGDFETYSETGGRLNHSSPHRTVINRQEIMGYSLKVITTPDVSDHVQYKFNQFTYNGPDAGDKFVQDFCSLLGQVQTETEQLEAEHGQLKPVAQFTPEELVLRDKKICHICDKRIVTNNRTAAEWKEEKVVWNDYLTGSRFLRVDRNSLPEGYWSGPKVIDHCHYR